MTERPDEQADVRVSAGADSQDHGAERAHPDDGAEPDENDPVRHWIKRSLAESELSPKMPDLLPGVQRRIRLRSRGKFFADGWSTTQARTSYVLVGVITLLLVALACVALSPWYGLH
jgi:hypothetical protein